VTRTSKKYWEFWAGQTSPLHRRHDDRTYRAYAEELKNIFAYFGYAGGNVLEIGCGNGALFPYFGFDSEKYLGIDFSASMLQIFRENCPGVRLVEGDAATYQPDAEYQLIFGNAVHQHFSPTMLKQHLNLMLPSLGQDGIYVLANLPYRPLKKRYRNGEFDSRRQLIERSSMQKLVISITRAIILILNAVRAERDGVGFWYSPDEILGFIGPRYTIEPLGSNFYAYRQHIVVRHVTPDPE
jgi:SAM-dependent methyltransferase